MTLVANRITLFTFLKASLLMQVSLLFLWGCNSSSDYQQFSGSTMGSTYHITANLEQGQSRERVQEVIDRALREIDESMSTYRNDSQISRFNVAGLQTQVEVSADFLQVLDISYKVYHQSGGVFDPTIGPLVDLWGFGSRQSLNQMQKIPDPVAIEATKARLGFLSLGRSGDKIWKTRPVEIDFSAVAPGYAADKLARLFSEMGIADYMVEIAGEIATHGKSPRGTPWRIGIEIPAQLRGKIQAAVDLGDAHLATSGDYRNYYEVDGVRYCHEIDPRTGYPVRNRLASVTVLADSTGASDAWATAMMVLGEKEGFVLAEKLKLAAYFIFRTDTGFDVRYTEPMREYLE
jgi:thiamine biosynthesis lipoprotein